MAEPPEDSLSFAKRMFGGNPFPKDDPRHELWEKTCRIWAEKDARVTAELLEKHPTNLQNPLPDIVELVTGRFNIGAECFLAFVVWNYESVALYEQILGKFMDTWLSLTLEHCPRGIEKSELLLQLKLRLTGRIAHWRAEALRLVRESKVKRPAATGNLDVNRANRALQEGQQALERLAAIRESLSSEASDSAQKPEPPQPADIMDGENRAGTDQRAAVDAYIEEVFQETGKRITRTDIWRGAGYRDRTEFQRFQRDDPHVTRSARNNFSRILKMDPKTFIEHLAKIHTKK